MEAKLDFLSGTGEMAALMRTFDWDSTILGTPEQWPELLKCSLRLILASKHPMIIWWGPELIQFYNNAFRETLEPDRHPSLLGRRGPESWGKTWPVIAPHIETIMAGCDGAGHQEQIIPDTRRESGEEIWWSYACSPIEDSHGVHGALAVCRDVTGEYRAREELKRLNEELSVQIRQREQMERHRAFQLELFDRMGSYSNPDDIASVAFEMLGKELDFTRAQFTQIDCAAQTYYVEYAWSRADAVNIKGWRGSLDKLGNEIIGPLLNGNTLAVADVTTDPRTEPNRAGYLALNIRSVLNVPILRDGVLAKVISLHRSTPYEWRHQEIVLLREIAHRICNALERAHNESRHLQSQQMQLTHQRAETELLRKLFQEAPGFIAILKGPDHRFEIVNDAYLQTIGYRQVVGKTMQDALPEMHEQGYIELLDYVYRSGKPYVAKEIPVRLQRRTDAGPEERFLNFVYQPVFAADGTVEGIFVEGNDVTDQVQAQRKEHFLLELADRLRPLSSSESIVSAAAELVGTYLGLSRALFAEVDREKETFRVRQDWARDGERSAVGLSKKLNSFGPVIIDALRAGQIINSDDVMADPRCRDSAPEYTLCGIRAYLTVPLVKNGNFEFMLCLHKKDPYQWTDHDRQVALETAERTWAAVESATAQTELSIVRDQSLYVFNTMTEGFGIVDSDWTIIQMNSEGLRMKQMKSEDVIGHNHWEVFPELAGTELAATYERVKATRIAETCEFFHTGRDGKNIWLEVRTYPARDGGLAFFFRDISIRKEFEHKLKLADRRKDEFVAMLAHELRNPLAPISAAADLLQMAQLDEESLMATSDIIARQVRHMTSLINDLMDVSRVTRGLIRLDSKVLHASDIVADAVEQVRPLIVSRGHHLSVQLPSEPVLVQGDQKRLVQVLANVLSNAAKYTPDGGELTLAIAAQADHVDFCVSDNGIGMMPEILNRVFELFAQAERSSDRTQGGLGIGLALVKSLVELHDGSVTAHSDGPGQGSRFTISLPRSWELVENNHPPEEAFRPASSKPLRLMLVDDNADAARTLSLFLKAAGHDVMVEHHPGKALERARAEVPDAFLLDIGLPDMDGNELARKLRSCSRTAGSVLIAVTGYGQEQDRIKAQESGFDHHFVKPVNTEELVSLLATLPRLLPAE
ncbi:PAS domain-containing protein [Oxalobacteraceae bacterium R-40]|uniref:histidine kinase n=1 Tax=Keguizhuia sedimenti TaxID=3064264 RepID=A0ABU1BRV7_9BURK|nr:PAS domain-containing protein [Oxalobacteraceae bacterium R-40]